MKKFRTFMALANTNIQQKAADDYRSYTLFLRKIEPYVSNLQNKSILDIGCGRFAPMSILLHSHGFHVTGIDSLYIGLHDSFIHRWKKYFSSHNIDTIVKEFFLDLFRLRTKYYLALQRLSGMKLKIDDLDIQCVNAENLSFPENYFDIVFAVTVFEHVSNVDKAAEEISKVLRSNGLAYLVIDLYTGISGSHNPLWNNTNRVPPWDHLRQQTWPLSTHLNKLRLDDYISILSKHFQILKMELDEKEGAKDLLTSEIRSQLVEYTEKELLSSALFLILRKVT
jgi:SAM-dependent methyltransferase